MYVDRLHVRHLKLLRDFSLDFTGVEGKPRMWTVIIGRNGTAKTSILQAIALAVAGSRQVNALAKPVVGHLVDRRSRRPMEIEASFRFTPRGSLGASLHPMLGRSVRSDERLCSTLSLRPKQSTVAGRSFYANVEGELEAQHKARGSAFVDPLDDARADNRPLWFVAGYGVGRFLPDPQSRPPLVQPSIERLEPLFRNTTALTSLGFLDHLSEAKARRFTKALRDTLIQVDDLVPDIVGIELKGKGGVTKSGTLFDKDRFALRVGRSMHKFPAVALSHGYQSTLAWIADLIGHVMWEAEDPVEAHDIEGLVLIDEIDLYLHPTWQAGLITALRRTFPKVQFVATTHSPVVLASLAPEEIVVVDQHPETGDVERFVHDPETGDLAPASEVVAEPRAPDPRAMTGTDVYRTWFGLDRLTLNPNGERLRRFLQLATDPFRSDGDEAELKKLMRALKRDGVPLPRRPVAREPS
ncbi:AAA family ATPase [Paraliomyxa miuraensis]|uniref:AAA family ATPase n=1 Tax=Paraliomyxa miuraensis TaxID=376150 RepID=UPI0022529D5E|nr:AAA family ATPase [Paraliomyxa miuraensis]MCX4240841.1 AAA family ATPase [Paraliomyxa miuraensis]